MAKFLIALSMMLILLLVGGVVWLLFVRPPGATPPEFVTLIGELSEQKSTATQTLDRVKQDYASRNIGGAECDRARKLYDDARTKFSRWIDEIRAGLDQSTPPQSIVKNKSLDEAIRAKQRFVDYVQASYGRIMFRIEPPDLTSLINSLGNILIHAWEAVNAQTADRIETMRKSLNEQKWGSFGICTVTRAIEAERLLTATVMGNGRRVSSCQDPSRSKGARSKGLAFCGPFPRGQRGIDLRRYGAQDGRAPLSGAHGRYFEQLHHKRGVYVKQREELWSSW